MRIDFYQLSRDPVERVVPVLAGKVLDSGSRLLIVARDDALRQALSRALWDYNGSFLANGLAGESDSTRQPILLSENCEAENGAGMICLADGDWRDEAGGFERALLIFAPERTQSARELWRSLGQAGHDLHIHKQTASGVWREGA